jgi:hypothetical protein
MLKIAIINPGRPNGQDRTVLDGLLQVQQDMDIDFKISEKFDYSLPLAANVLPRQEFLEYGIKADLIFLMWAKEGTDYALAQKIGRWPKTVYIDGSEVGKNRRYDFTIQKDILDLRYPANGAIDRTMLKQCPLYFRRERPYPQPIIPLPFGIESIYLSGYNERTDKDIDFFCIFGQDEYPLMRRYAREMLEKFCVENSFVCRTERTRSREEFYQLLARSKVGISIGGGGFDSYRFWEILANNCLLITEQIDIYDRNSTELDFPRIKQFHNLFDFKYLLAETGEYLKKEYKQEGLEEDYRRLVQQHSSRARVMTILNAAEKAGIIEFEHKA